MADTNRLIAAGLLGLVGGGLQGYQNQRNVQKEYAINALKERPEVEKSYEWLSGLKPGQPLPPEYRQPATAFTHQYLQDKSPFLTTMGGESFLPQQQPAAQGGGEGGPPPPPPKYIPGSQPVSKHSVVPHEQRAPTPTEEFKGASARVAAALKAGRNPDPTDQSIVTRYKQGTQPAPLPPPPE